MAHRVLAALTYITLLTVAGCGVERVMTIDSDPPGALVYLNDTEVGRTPLKRDFTWYGKYDVILRKEGYQPLQAKTDVNAPWWQWVPFDFFAELSPVRLTDRQHLHYALTPASTQPADANALIDRARNLQTELQFGEERVITKRIPKPSTSTTTTAP